MSEDTGSETEGMSTRDLAMMGIKDGNSGPKNTLDPVKSFLEKFPGKANESQPISVIDGAIDKSAKVNRVKTPDGGNDQTRITTDPAGLLEKEPKEQTLQKQVDSALRSGNALVRLSYLLNKYPGEISGLVGAGSGLLAVFLTMPPETRMLLSEAGGLLGAISVGLLASGDRWTNLGNALTAYLVDRNQKGMADAVAAGVGLTDDAIILSANIANSLPQLAEFFRSKGVDLSTQVLQMIRPPQVQNS
ncbi:hypothetical protein HYS93_02030 [Candidatus Daviesbacteria bacterium]|nr:hypothetical protein [Candidatus Daviesbacteria bacterium]